MHRIGRTGRAGHAALFEAELREGAREDGLESYLPLVEEPAEQGLDVAEIAAAAAGAEARRRCPGRARAPPPRRVARPQ